LTTEVKQKYCSSQLLSKWISIRNRRSIEATVRFRRKEIEPIGSISLLVSFNTLSNARTEYITFDVVDMSYPYNVIFGRGILNTFEAALHSLYLCLKIPATLGVISVHGNQKDARNIEQGFTPGLTIVNCLQDEKPQGCSSITRKQNEGSFASMPIEPECETKRVMLDLRVPNKTSREEAELLSFLGKNNDVFAWRSSDLMGVSRDII
jgi:hypothetical protein